MTKTMTRPTRWFAATGLGVIAAWTLASCGGGPPDLTDISETAKQSMEEATSFTYTMSDPDEVHDEEVSSAELSGQTDEANFHIALANQGLDLEVLVVDESSSYIKMGLDDEADDDFFANLDTNGKWIEAPESEIEDLIDFNDGFDSTIETTFSLIEGLSEEELDTVEVEETELDGQEVYKYIIPATAEGNSNLYTGAETVAFYFLQESSELVQVDATSEAGTATHAFSDLNEVELFEAPAEDEIADLDWSF